MINDQIGRSDFVNKIIRLVDSLQEDANMTLEINGQWGSGKTFVLNLIEEKMEEKGTYILVKYDAWANTFYSDPLIAILSCLLDAIKNKSLLRQKVGNGIKGTKDVVVNELKELSPEFKKLNEIFNDLKVIGNGFSKIIQSDKVEDFQSYATLLKNVKNVLGKIIKKHKCKEDNTKLIVLVDELDRCLPDEQLKILERLHHLFDIENCAVIVALNEESVVTTVKTIYGIDGHEYLRKFFDFSFKLEVSSEQYLKTILKDFGDNLKKFKKREDLNLSCIDTVYQIIAENSNGVLKRIDNRDLSRYYDCLLKICNEWGWEKLSWNNTFFIMIALFIRKNISNTFLDIDVLETNQQENENLSSISQTMFRPTDYIDKYFKIETRTTNSTENEFQFWHQYSPNYMMEETIDQFNQYIHISFGNKSEYIKNHTHMDSDEWDQEIWKKLRELVVLYSGEQER